MAKKPAKPPKAPPRSEASFAHLALTEQISEAMARHVAQCAWIVYAADYTSNEADEARIQDARKVLADWTAQQRGDQGDPLNAVLRKMLEGEGREGSGPATMPDPRTLPSHSASGISEPTVKAKVDSAPPAGRGPSTKRGRK